MIINIFCYHFIFGAGESDWEWFGAFLIVLGILGALLYIISAKMKSDDKKREELDTINAKEIKDQIDEAIETSSKIDYPKKIIYVKSAEAFKYGIEKRVFKNPQNVKQNLLMHKYSDNYTILSYGPLLNESSLAALSAYAEENNFTDYSFVDITRSTNPKIQPGSYLYTFDKNGNLSLLSAPIYTTKDININVFTLYDSDRESKKVLIKFTDIKDFQYFGTQLVESTVSSAGPKTVGIINTGLSEIFFGSSYTILKGLSKLAVGTSHEIKDLRVVQLILADKSDIEFMGISIYYELNRRMGNVKNKESENTKESPQKKDTDYLTELKTLKELYDSEILTKEEFEKKKKQILDR